MRAAVAPPLLLLTPVGLLLLLLFLVPLAAMLAISLGAPDWTVSEYARLLGDSFYLAVLARSLVLGFIVAMVTVLLGLPLAYWLARMQSRWAPALLVLATFPLWISSVVRAFGWIVLLSRGGPVSMLLQGAGLAGSSFQLAYTISGVVLALVQVLLPFMLLSLYGLIRAIDPELELAAQNIGAGPVRAVLFVTLPLAARGILSAALLVFALSISAFATPSLVGGARVQLMATTIYEQMTELADWQFAAAISFVLLLVVLVISLISTWLGGADRVASR
jgi:ABC-type spermidine/putrescine transport system permease subunit I